MAIGIICAIPQEVVYLRGRLRDTERTALAGIDFDSGEIDEQPVVLVASGMGKVNMGLVATLLVDRFHCTAIVFTGVAGGLDPQLHIGDIVIADRVVQHDFGVIMNERLQAYQPGHLPFVNRTERLGYEPDPGLMEHVKRLLPGLTLPALSAAQGDGRPPRIGYGTVLTGDQYLHCEATRIRLRNDFGGVAIDMESGALAQVCESFGVPWLVVRGLSDLAGADSGVDFQRFLTDVAGRSAHVLLHLLPALAAAGARRA